MTKKISRRSFIKQGTAIGASSVMGAGILAGLEGCSKTAKTKSTPGMKETAVSVAVIQGENYFDNAARAVELLGGMKRFVSKGSRVAILPNSQRNNPGAFTSPEVVRAVIRMCKEAGAKEINCLSWLPARIWESTGLGAAVKEEGANLKIADRKDESLFKPVPVPEGRALKEARIMKEFFAHDVFINIPITKDHAGNKFTGTLKNLMGLNSPPSNRTFHKKGWTTNIDSIAFLDQCIADLNTLFKPHLCVVDATEFITTNGPFGPGKLIKPGKVVVGTDRVAVDAYCCTLWGLKPEDIIMIDRAFRHNLGQMDLAKVNIKEMAV